MNVPVVCTTCGHKDVFTREDLSKDSIQCKKCKGTHLELHVAQVVKKVRQSKTREGETPRPVPGSVATAVFKRLAERRYNSGEVSKKEDGNS